MPTRADSPGDEACLHKRLPCEILVEGRTYKALTTTLTPQGLFIQLAGSSLPERGVELTIDLRGQIGAPAIRLRGIVTRRQRGEMHAEASGRGVEVRLVEAPIEYHEIFVREAQGDAHAIEILIEIDEEVGLQPERSEEPRPEALEDARGAQETRSPPTAAAPASPPITAAAAPGSDTAVCDSSRIDPSALHSDARSAAALSREPDGPQAVVVYEGDALRDIYEMLEELGARPERARLHGPTRFTGFSKTPPMLFVIGAHDALSRDLPMGGADEGVTRIAVTSSKSEMLGSMLRRRGYDYLVRRPYHRRALEMLLRGALHVGRDQRDVARTPLGIAAWLQLGRWRWPRACTLLDLSPGGCRLATHEHVPLLTQVGLTIFRAPGRGAPIALSGRVVRRRHDDESGEDLLALRFGKVSKLQCERIERLLTRDSIGPTSLRNRSLGARFFQILASVGRRESPAPDTLGQRTAPEATPFPEQEGAKPERRHLERATLDREVLALDPASQRVLDVLAGRDLSVRGLRVDPHPDLAPGDRVVLALYDSAGRGTLELAAEVARDDGAHGLALLFQEMDSETAAALEQLVASLPSVERLDTPVPQSLVLGQIVPRKRLPFTPDRVDAAARRRRRQARWQRGRR